MSRRAIAAVAALAASALVIASFVGVDAPRGSDLPPNVIVVVTDDQSYDTMRDLDASMPWFASQLGDPSTGWVTFTNAVVTTPMCCPSRASILTGRYAAGTGVTSNLDGDDLDESTTIAVPLHEAGYRTAMIGKYLNGYPWDRGPYVPAGWDRWLAKTNDSLATTYQGYGLVDQTSSRRMGATPADYVTDVVGREAVRFIDTAPTDRPWFLYVAPPAPHEPWTPAPRHDALLAGAVPPPPLESVVNDVDGKPGWVRALPLVSADELELLQRARVAERATLRAVDEWLRAIWTAVARRGEADRTVMLMVSDNGYHFGEHRWRGKQTPYEPSIHVPLAIRVPGVTSRSEARLVANVDLAPTIADLAGVPFGDADGKSLVPILRQEGHRWRSAVPITWEGSADVPAWSALRVGAAVYIRNADGTEEFYDLSRDPSQVDNTIDALGARERLFLRRSLASLLIGSASRR